MRNKKSKLALILLLLMSFTVLLWLITILLPSTDSKYSSFMQKNNTPTPTPIEYYFPVVTTKRVVVSAGTEVAPEMFIQSLESIFDVSFHYEEKPDFNRYGLQEVIILAVDTEGNSAAKRAQINILNIKEKLELHLGEPLPKAEDFLMEPGSAISMVTDISKIDTSVLAEYEIEVLVDGDSAKSVLVVNDFKAPEVEVRNLEGWAMQPPLSVDDFIVSIQDTTDVEKQFVSEPDWNLPGKQQVVIRVLDENNNCTECTAELTLKQDTKAPVVSVTDVDITVGGVIAYKKAVSYYDDAASYDQMSLEIDNSRVNADEAGSYEVTYTVKDFAGNSTSVVGKVNVVEEAPLWNDEEKLLEKANQVLSEIMTEGMSEREKAEAIFNWVNKNVRFINFSEKGNFIRGAYEGLFLNKGDCFVYAATSEYLLSLAEIQNIGIKKITDDPVHYWNLVYMEDGWYHFDACPNKKNQKLFLYTDAELEQYSQSNDNSHVYDKALYPEIK